MTKVCHLSHQPFPYIVRLCRRPALEGSNLKRPSLTALATLFVMFAANGSAEMILSHHKAKAKKQVQLIPAIPAGLTSESTRASGAGSVNRRSRHKNSQTDASSFVAPVMTTAETSPRIRAGRHHKTSTGTPVMDVSPLFLPVANVSPSASGLTASGGKAGRRFRRHQIDTPTLPSVAGASLAAVPEPASTSLVLIGLFGAALVTVRRFRTAKAQTAVQ